MTINNQEILETFWSSNTPDDIMQFLFDKKAVLVDLNPEKYTSGLIITRDICTKKIHLYFGMTKIIDEKEDLKYILSYGTKLEGGILKNLINYFNEEEENHVN